MLLQVLLVITNLALCAGHFESTQNIHTNSSNQYCFPDDHINEYIDDVVTKIIISKKYRDAILKDPMKNILETSKNQTITEYTNWKKMNLEIIFLIVNNPKLFQIDAIDAQINYMLSVAKNNFYERTIGKIVKFNEFAVLCTLMNDPIALSTKNEIKPYAVKSMGKLMDYLIENVNLFSKKSKDSFKYTQEKYNEWLQIKEKYTNKELYSDKMLMIMIKEDLKWLDEFMFSIMMRATNELNEWKKIHEDQLQKADDEFEFTLKSLQKETIIKVTKKLYEHFKRTNK